MERVAIVGAGVAGAGVAYALRDVDVFVSVFEQAAAVGGRAATRRMCGCTYDPGANYVKSDDPVVTELITETLDTDGLIDIAAPVWTFTADGTISEGDDTDEHKWTYENGIAQLPTRLFERTDAAVFRDSRVKTISHEENGWSLTSDSDSNFNSNSDVDVDAANDTDRDLGTFDMLVLTPPAPQSAALIESMRWEHDLRDELHAAITEVEYRPIYTALLHYPFELDVPYYALVNTDREHEIGWISREECKPNHVPDGEALLVVQMAPDWSARRMNQTDSMEQEHEHTSAVAELTADLFDDDRLASPDWTDTQKWQHALPDTDGQPPLGTENARTVRRRAEQHGLYLAGDWLAGDGRIHLALKNGLTTGERIGSR